MNVGSAAAAGLICTAVRRLGTGCAARIGCAGVSLLLGADGLPAAWWRQHCALGVCLAWPAPESVHLREGALKPVAATVMLISYRKGARQTQYPQMMLASGVCARTGDHAGSGLDIRQTDGRG